MRRIADNRLVEVSYLNIDSTIDIGNRAKIADMAIATDPYRGTLGYGLPLRGFEPFIKSASIAADIGMGGTCHFQTAARV